MEKENKQSQVQMKMLLESVLLLAAPYEQQTQALPPFVHIPDEIALIFDETYRLTDVQVKNGLVTTSQKALLDRLDTLLAQMSENTPLWTVIELKDSLAWEQVRALASEIVAAFHIPLQPPQLFWIHYVPGSEEPQN